VAINPVELISLARKRIARNAAIQASIYFLAPALTAIALGAMVPAIGAMTWERMGYFLAPELMLDARGALLAVGFVAILIGAYRGWRAYSASDDFVGAAIQVDERAHAHQQVVTLATLSNPAAPVASQSALFPVLWRNVTAALSSFNPQNEFAVEVGKPIKKSSLPSAAIAIALGLAALALIRPPSPLQQTAMELRRLADKIEASAKSREDKQIAEKIKKVATNLTNTNVPPDEKKKELDAVLAEVEKKEANAGDQAGAATGSSKGSGSGASSSSSAGGSEGKGEGGQSQGQGKGTGKGEGKGGTGSAQNKGGKKNGENNGTADSIELKSEIAKAQAQVQTEDIAANQTPNKPSPDAKTAQAPQPGNDPNQQGGSPKNPDQKGNAPMPIPQASNNAANKMPNGQQGKQQPKGGTGGDTHLGEFPTAANYERFLKPGEKGLHIGDARYVVFKIPSGPTSGGEGKTVIDTERPKATTAYTNAPLAPTADTAPPDERQLVPPRYRDLIH
jgi:hypothetical protein